MIEEDCSIERFLLASKPEDGEPQIYRYIVLASNTETTFGTMKFIGRRVGRSAEQVVSSVCGTLHVAGFSGYRVEVYNDDVESTTSALATCESVHTHAVTETST